jgi:hypothetical protein
VFWCSYSVMGSSGEVFGVDDCPPRSQTISCVGGDHLDGTGLVHEAAVRLCTVQPPERQQTAGQPGKDSLCPLCALSSVGVWRAACREPFPVAEVFRWQACLLLGLRLLTGVAQTTHIHLGLLTAKRDHRLLTYG